MTVDVKFCGMCGASLRPGSRFCTSCGQVVSVVSTATDPALPQSADPAEFEETVAMQPAVSAPPIPPYARPPAQPLIAPLISRIAALLLDSIALFGVFFLIGVVVANRTGDTTESGFNLDGGPAAIVVLLTTAVALVYFVLMEGIAGATLGKMALAVRVVRRDNVAPDLAAALVRNLLRIIDGIAVYLVGLIAALLSPLRQRFGDRAAGTIVVRANVGGRARIVALAIALIVALGGSGLALALRSPAAQTPTVTATLARGATADFQPVNPTNQFPSNADIFHLVFTVSGAPPNSELMSRWIAVNVGNAARPNTVIDEATIRLSSGGESGNFRLRRGNTPWPPGQYRVELYLNGDLIETFPFTVQR
jgi:uncharacterized RDD family membrane protein YckC